MRSTLLILLLAAAASVHADEMLLTVADPYIELHTGPGKGYPVFHVAERGEAITVLKRRTGWYRVRTRLEAEGWVPDTQLERTLQPDGEPLRLRMHGFADFEGRRWEMGVQAGDFGGANVVSTYGGFALSANLSTELSFSQALGPFSDSTIIQFSAVHQFFPEWRVTPYFTLGTGMIRTDPKATLVQTEDRNDPLAHAGFGLRAWLTRQFLVRAEYKSYVVFTSRDDNEEITEWKAGFSFYF